MCEKRAGQHVTTTLPIKTPDVKPQDRFCRLQAAKEKSQKSADDVMVDGKIITGEDDHSSRLFGATLAKLLTRVSD